MLISGAELYAGQQRGHQQEGLVPFVVDAVYAMAHALEDMRVRKCGRNSRGLCAAMRKIDGSELLQFIRNVSFQGASLKPHIMPHVRSVHALFNVFVYFSTGVSDHVVKFNADGDAPGRYSVYQYQQTKFCVSERDDCHGYVKIGTWDET